jgi:DNA helicase II / ATP-dependent DNA helicase PcrA
VLTYAQFVEYIRASIPRFSVAWLNDDQADAVAAAPHPPTFIVAGPGAGKTTVLALRALKLILVDGISPNGIIATTFTRKAAAELRSRILAWGYAVVTHARTQAANAELAAWLSEIDANAVLVGTLDSLSEDIIATCRPPGGITPATIEGFLSTAIMRRHGLFPNGRHRDPNLEAFIGTFVPAYPGPRPTRVKLGVSLSFSDRVRHDQIDLAAFQATGQGQNVLSLILTDYFAYLQSNYLADFARLERLFLDGLLANNLHRVTDGIRAILVDEFQDTNYLQEQIYFELCRRTGASLTVVGDDDQSIFRFRGATVELFADFQNRIATSLGAAWSPQRVDLVSNYRSSGRIVNFCNSFIQLDPTYQAARVPGKQALVPAAAHAPEEHLPVLGMFRQDRNSLANDLTGFLTNVFRNGGHFVQCQDAGHTVVRADDGDFGDAVLLSRSAGEYSSGDNPRARLPLLLRQQLENTHHIPVFNPRGRSLFQIESVQRLLGLALQCIDPNEAISQAIPSVPQSARTRMQTWRAAAAAFAQSNPMPGGLPAFIQNWQTRTPTNMAAWPSEWPLLELLFTLVTWIPEFQSDPEGQVYLEAMARTVSEAGQFSSYGARILNGQGPHDANSVRAAIREVFENIANGDVEVDEEIMPYIPRRYFPIMTVHQAKGLEFPLVIVDVGSDFRTNNVQQRRFRCPESPDQVHEIEQIVSPFCPVGNARTQRNPIDRAWDDLRRLYFVAFSRPQNALLLVGLTSQIGPNPRVRSVATGDTRQGARGLTFVPAAQWHSGMPPDCVALI